MAEESNNVRIKLTGVRLSYPHLFVKQAYQENAPKYSASFILDPSTKQGAKDIKAIEDAVEKLKKKIGLKKLGEDKCCLKDGGEDDENTNGKMIVRSSNTARPKVKNRRGKDLAEGDDGSPYGGCYVNAIIDVYGNVKYKGVFATLMGVQMVRDGESFGGNSRLEDGAFEDLGDAEDDEV